MGLKRQENIHFAEVGDEYFVLLEDADVLACINAPAFTVLSNLDGFTELRDLAEALGRASRVPAEECLTAMQALCVRMGDLGFLVEVERPGPANKGPFNLDYDNAMGAVPKVIRTWDAAELKGGLFVNTGAGDIGVIVPDVTDGPIKTCPPQTCTIPAGLFTANTIIRTFDSDRREHFASFRRDGFVHFGGQR